MDNYLKCRLYSMSLVLYNTDYSQYVIYSSCVTIQVLALNNINCKRSIEGVRLYHCLLRKVQVRQVRQFRQVN